MVEIKVAYLGELRCSASHGPSGMQLMTDAPLDNKGKGEAFSPTDLVATALGTCMLTTMGIRTHGRELPLSGATASVKKHMTKEPPRRIETLEVAIRFPRGREIAPADRELLENIAHTCPVRLSLLGALQVPVAFAWE